MTDITPSSAEKLTVSTDRRRALHKRRYGSEFRFKYLGLGAILISVSFLVLLLSTVIFSGLPAFTYNYLNLSLDLTAVDPANPEAGDYDGILRQGISEAMPFLEGRKGRRLARNMVSSGAGLEFRREVLGNTELAGKNQILGIPVSDFADLYLKGLTAKPVLTNPNVDLKVSDISGSVSIEASEEVFQPFLKTVKISIGEQAELVRKRMAAVQRSLDQQLEIKATSQIAEEVSEAAEQAEVFEQNIATIKAQFDALLLRKNSADSQEVLDRTMPSLILRVNEGAIKVTEVGPNAAKGDVIVPLSTNVASSGEWTMQVIAESEANRKFSDSEVAVMDKLVNGGAIEKRWNSIFFTKGASREPEMAGIWGAVIGSFFTMLITLMLSFPLGVAAAIYLEEFAPKNRLTQLIEVNINNLAAVPSIVFGLLGLAVFLNFFELPRSAPLVGGMVLALMTLPTIIIASRAALKAVPPSIREAALGVGASKLQAVFHHVLPLAMPGILTGTIIGMAQALGETAPLLMIGMVAFVVDIPGGITDPATVLPVQIYMWADFPEPGFQQKTAAAIMVLLMFLVVMNALAVFLRKRFERRW